MIIFTTVRVCVCLCKQVRHRAFESISSQCSNLFCIDLVALNTLRFDFNSYLGGNFYAVW